jgi:hypothetical protein
MQSNTHDAEQERSPRDHMARVAALRRFIDWAEREAASLNAPDCSICLQLARVALDSGDTVGPRA